MDNLPPNRSLISRILPENNTIHCLLLLLFALLMFLIRTVPIYTKIFTSWPGEYGNYVNFSADDAIYHMRLIHNTLHHFPWRVFFDPFTHFPFGSYVAFGPLFTNIIATAALVIGLGRPSPELINHVSAYIPPIMGILCLFPVYFIVRKLFGKTPAIISAFILTFLPGEFLNRSTLGFVDHHVAEILFSTTTCAFLIYALDAAKSFGFTFSEIKQQNNRPALIYSLLCGITFSLFILIWQGALMFGAIFLIFFIIQLFIERTNNNNTDYLLFLVGATYIPPALIVLPYMFVIPLAIYPSNNIPILTIMIAIFVVCYLLHIALKPNKLTKKLYPLALTFLFILIIFILNKYFPLIYAPIHNGYDLLFHPTPGMATISEVHPSILDLNGKLSIQLFWNSLFWTMPMAIVGLGYLGYRTYKNQHPADVFLLIWEIIIIVAACAQIRFNYYLAVNVVILAGLPLYALFYLISGFNPKTKLVIKLQKLIFFTLFFFIALLLIDPIFLLLINRSVPSGVHITQGWYNTLIWLKNHTPNHQGKVINKNFDYTSGYYPTPSNLNTHYNYPKSAYGVMSWWDQGHQITYVAERIPNATPFQDGVVEKDGKTGAALFFTSTNEEQAVRNLDAIGSRYIIITRDIASTKFYGIAIWSNDTKDWYETKDIKIDLPEKILHFKASIDSAKFSRSMVSRLFYNDANGLQHFRLIHEEDSDYYILIRQAKISPQPNTISLSLAELLFKNYAEATDAVKKINQILANGNNTVFAYSARPPTKDAKIFEKVKGATINGKVPNNITTNTQVKLTLQLKTKYDRIFIYEQTTKVIDGKYSFIVPYPTTQMYGDDYSYDIEPIGNYQIQINGLIIEVSVPEEAIMLGKTIHQDLNAPPYSRPDKNLV